MRVAQGYLFFNFMVCRIPILCMFIGSSLTSIELNILYPDLVPASAAVLLKIKILSYPNLYHTIFRHAGKGSPINMHCRFYNMS